MGITRPRARVVLGSLIALAGALIVSPIVLACTTPVHRYAMYNWRPSTYLVCWFFDGEAGEAEGAAAEAARAVNAALEKMSGSESPVNVAYQPVDIRDTALLGDAPPPVKRMWEENRERELPFHAVFSPPPIGALLHVGRLDEKELEAMTESPARTRLAEVLQEGRHGALVFLPGEDAERTERARAGAREAVRLAAEKLPLMAPPPPPLPGGESAREEAGGEGEADDYQVGLVEVRRDDPAEAWFVRQLLAVDHELAPEERSLPMVFGVYGRGRALLPYLGDGISAENLLDVIAFMNGPCSCQVKDQNPGIDLLVSWDWEKAARDLARRVGRETGNEMLLDELGYEYEEVAAGVPAAAVAPAGGAAEGEGDAPTAAAEAEVDAAVAAPPAADGAVAPAPAPAQSASTSSKRYFLVAGLVTAAAALALVIATAVLVRRRA